MADDRNIFGDLLGMIGAGALDGAFLRTEALVRAAGDQLPDTIGREFDQIAAGFRAVGGPVSGASAETRRALGYNLTMFIYSLQLAWQKLPAPATASQAPTATPQPPASEEPPPDRREEKLVGSPLRSVAWLTEGVRVSQAVCRIKTPEKLGTGFVVAGGLLVTNNHVLPTPELASEADVYFNYQEDAQGRPLAHWICKVDPSLFETEPAPIDCTIVRLKASPEELQPWGTLDIDPDFGVGDAESVSIIQHPDGQYKQISLTGNVLTATSDPTLVQYYTSTMPGSSGSPVFGEDWRVVALHRAAGDYSQRFGRYLNNQGVRFSAILAHPKLGPLLRPKARN